MTALDLDVGTDRSLPWRALRYPFKRASAACWRRLAPRIEAWPTYLLAPASAWYTRLDPRLHAATLCPSSPWFTLAVDGRVLALDILRLELLISWHREVGAS